MKQNHKKEIVDTHNVENFVENFAKVYYSWEQSDKSIDNRTSQLKDYLTEELQPLCTKAREGTNRKLMVNKKR